MNPYCLWGILYRFNFFNRYKPIQTICSFLYEFWPVVSSKELVHFIYVIEFVDIVHSIPLLSFWYHGILYWYSLFSSENNNVCLLSFFLSLARGLVILLVFSENQDLVSVIFFADLLFSTNLISALIFIICLLLAFDLISHLSYFLRWKFQWLILVFFFSNVYI